MHPEVLQEYKLGDMVARYLIDRNSMQVGFQLLPENVSQEHIVTDNCFMESLIQYKLTGDIYNEAYAGGCSMRNSESVRKLRFSEQTDETTGEQICVNTIMMDEDGHRLIHHLVWMQNTPYGVFPVHLKTKAKEIVVWKCLRVFLLEVYPLICRGMDMEHYGCTVYVVYGVRKAGMKLSL